MRSSKLRSRKSTTKLPPLKPFTYHQRILDLDRITSTHVEEVASGDNLCLKGKTLGNVAEIINRIGTPSIYGEAFSAIHKISDKKNIRISVKKVPILPTDLKEVFSKKALLRGNSVWGELLSYILCTVLVLGETTQNLPIYYRYYTCDKCHFENKNIDLGHDRPCMYIINELADYDLKQFLEKNFRDVTNDLIINAIFQITQALYTLKIHLGMTHNDLHYGNVLVHKVQQGGYWNYIIDGKDYFLPNLGFVFVLWDFGMAHIPKKIRGRPHFKLDAKNPIHNETDIERIVFIIKDVLEEKDFDFSQPCKNLLNYIINNKNVLKDIFKYPIMKQYLSVPPEDEILQTFNTNRNGVYKAIQKDLQYLFLKRK